MKANPFERLAELQELNEDAGAFMAAMRPRFERLANRHEDGTAPRAVSAFQLFQTPQSLAKKMAELAGDCLRGRVLEPSVGLGRLLDEIAAFSPREVVAVEMAANIAGELYRQNREGVRILQRDFLTLDPKETGRFDAVVMNPPFTMRSDIKHIQHAKRFLAPGGVLVALCLDTFHRETALRGSSVSWHKVPAGVFGKEGTNVATVLAVFRG